MADDAEDVIADAKLLHDAGLQLLKRIEAIKAGRTKVEGLNKLARKTLAEIEFLGRVCYNY